jgi:hypothetical protein
VAAFDQIVNSATKRQTRCSETNIPSKVHDGDGTDLPLICGQRWHVCLSESREIARRFLTKANNRPRSREIGSYPKSASHTLAYIPSDKPVQRTPKGCPFIMCTYKIERGSLPVHRCNICETTRGSSWSFALGLARHFSSFTRVNPSFRFPAFTGA